jgi:hypothetical protein
MVVIAAQEVDNAVLLRDDTKLTSTLKEDIMYLSILSTRNPTCCIMLVSMIDASKAL